MPSDKYYQRIKEIIQKRVCERYRNISKEQKEKM